MSRPAHADGPEPFGPELFGPELFGPEPFGEGICRSWSARLGDIEREEWVEIATAAGTPRVATSPPTKYLPDE